MNREAVIVESVQHAKKIIEYCDSQARAWDFIEEIAKATADFVSELSKRGNSSFVYKNLKDEKSE